MAAKLSPEHLTPYTRPCPPDLSTFLRELRPDAAAVLGLACRCGEPSLIVGVNFNWEVVDTACGTCGHEFSLYDPQVHGHDGWRGVNDYDRPPFEVLANGCKCRMFLFRLAVAVCYQPDAASGEDFTWFAVAGRCDACREVSLILDVEAS